MQSHWCSSVNCNFASSTRLLLNILGGTLFRPSRIHIYSSHVCSVEMLPAWWWRMRWGSVEEAFELPWKANKDFRGVAAVVAMPTMCIHWVLPDLARFVPGNLSSFTVHLAHTKVSSCPLVLHFTRMQQCSWHTALLCTSACMQLARL